MKRNTAETSINSMSKGKIFIVRPLPVILAFFVLGLIACLFLFKYIIIIYLALIFFALFLFIFKVIDKKLFFACLFAIILSLEGLCVKAIYNNYALAEGFYSGTGVVSSIDSSGTAIIENVMLEGEKIKGKILVYNLDANIGDYISFAGNLTNLHLYDRFDLHRIVNGTFYKMDISFSKFENSVSLSFRDSILMGVKDGFERITNKTTADYVMSIMFGRSDFLDSSIKQDFVAIGSAHVFAVSGLHIGVMVSVLLFIMKKLKINKKCTFVVITVMLIIYNYLCSFSPSVIRASLMTIIPMILFRTKFSADKISVLCFTAFISLVINPLWIGDLSFILSYGAIAGIYLLFPFFKRPFEHSKRFKGILNLLSLNLAVSISLIPLTVMFFGKYSLFGIIASLVIIPLTSLLFVVAFVTIPFLFIPFITIPSGLVIKYLVLINRFTAQQFNVLKAEISFSMNETGILFWYMALITISDFVNIDWKKKSIFSLLFVCFAFLF